MDNRHTASNAAEGIGVDVSTAAVEAAGFALGDDRGASKQARRPIKGLPRQVAETEALLARKLAEYKAALAERERLVSRLRVVEALVPHTEGALHNISAYHTAQRQAITVTATAAPATGGWPSAPDLAPVAADGAQVGAAQFAAEALASTGVVLPAAGTGASPFFDPAFLDALSPGLDVLLPNPDTPGLDLGELDLLNLEALSDAELLNLFPATPSEAEAGQTLMSHQPSSQLGSTRLLEPGGPGSAATAGTGGSTQMTAGVDRAASSSMAAMSAVGDNDSSVAAAAAAVAVAAAAPELAGVGPKYNTALAQQLQERGVTLEQGSAMVVEAWRAYVKAASFLLARLGVRPDEEALVEEALKQHWERFMATINAVHLHQPLAWFAVLGVNIDTGQREEPAAGHWRGVALAARLRADQVLEVREMVAMYDERIQEVAAEREKLAAELSAAMAATPEMATDSATLDASAAVRTLSERLARNTERQRMLMTTVYMYISYSPSIDAVMCARVNLASWPYLPDGLAILRALIQVDDEQREAQRGPRC